MNGWSGVLARWVMLLALAGCSGGGAVQKKVEAAREDSGEVQTTVITGLVRDAQTGETIKAFTLRECTTWRAGEAPVWQQYDALSRFAQKEAGKFTLAFEMAAHRTKIRVQAEGYLPEDSPEFALDGMPRTLEFRLWRGAAMKGRVVDGSGKSIPGALVLVVTAGDVLTLLNGTVAGTTETRYPHTRTGGDGQFSLPEEKGDFAMVVVADEGMCILRQGEPREKVTLKPWAVVRGRASVGEVVAESGTIDAAEGAPYVGMRYRVRTDGQGRFEIRRVGVGELILKDGGEGKTVKGVEIREGETYEVVVE